MDGQKNTSEIFISKSSLAERNVLFNTLQVFNTSKTSILNETTCDYYA